MTDYQVIIETIAATTTASGLTEQAFKDDNVYPTRIKVPDADINAVPLTRQDFHGEWNYCIHSGLTREMLQDKTTGPGKSK